MEMIQVPIEELKTCIESCTDLITRAKLKHIMYKYSGIESKLKTFCAIQILKYDLNNMCTDMDYDLTFGTSLLEHEIMTSLKSYGVTLDQIEHELIELDWTDCLGNAGSGKRERSFIMDYVKELYYEC